MSRLVFSYWMTTNVVVGLFCTSALAQPASGDGQPPERVIKELQLTNAPIDDVLTSLRAADPGLQIILARDSGAFPKRPIISELKVNNVTASQILEALASIYPALEISATRDDFDRPIIWMIRVKAVDPPERPRITQVFRLRDAVECLLMEGEPPENEPSHAELRKRARDAALSLIETALRTTVEAQDEPPQLQLHEATETMILRGTADQARLVENAIATLCPTPRLFAPAAAPRPDPPPRAPVVTMPVPTAPPAEPVPPLAPTR